MRNKYNLEPCPFCGNPDVWLSKCQSAVKCNKCLCKAPIITPFINKGMKEEDAARAAWNTRANVNA